MRYFCKTWKEKQLTSRPGYFMYIGPGSETIGNFEKYPDDLEGHGDEPAKLVLDVYLVQKHPVLKGCIIFQTGN